MTLHSSKGGAKRVLTQQQPVDIETLVDNGHIAAEDRSRPIGQGQHFKIAADDDVRLLDRTQRAAQFQRGLGNGRDAMRELRVARPSELDRLDTVHGC